jgi:hypothetical protein
LSLPYIFQTALTSIPSNVPYLTPDATKVTAWAARLADEHRLKIGLVWAGSPLHTNDHYRSVQFDAFVPLAAIPGIVFISLQKGPPSNQAQPAPAGMEIIDYTADLHDFADTAALIANLDLVISVDTAIVHLAGALARPVWTLLSLSSDWRWMLNRADTLWYPTMRLFRQSTLSDWTGPIHQMTDALWQWASEHAAKMTGWNMGK